jgi:mevalonate kinase
MVDAVAKHGERRPDLLAKTISGVEALVNNAELCIRAGDLQGLGKLMDLNQMLLSGLFVSTPEIERACAIARDAGALGAKLTGAGGGGAVLALCAPVRDGKGTTEQIIAAWRGAGFEALSAVVRATSLGTPL